jgi:replicative DNA helicase
MELRTKARRLQAESGLDLVIVDYLQLMQSTRRAENRVQEVSEISRGLKMIAKELDVPVMALSQLSRRPEERPDKRPQLSDLRDSGCLTGDTRILRADTGEAVEMRELYESGERQIPVWTLDDRYRLVRGTMTHVFSSGVKRTFELRLRSGRSVKASANHPFLTFDGWRALEDIAVGDRIAVPRHIGEPTNVRTVDEDELVLAASPLTERGFHAALGTPYNGTALYKSNVSRARLARVAAVLDDRGLLDDLATSDVLWDEVAAIDPLGEEEGFDATVRVVTGDALFRDIYVGVRHRIAVHGRDSCTAVLARKSGRIRCESKNCSVSKVPAGMLVGVMADLGHLDEQLHQR